jgi:magnesium chelatase family protein
MTPKMIKKYCEPDPGGCRMLELVTDKLGLSARTYNRILKVARTIADLEASPGITETHISEAIQYRSLDRRPG